MGASVALTLGGIVFTDLEIPENIPTGGTQKLAKHELIGGIRIMDTMGRSDRPLTWSGTFLGGSAQQRARSVEALRVGGLKQILTWSQYRYAVVVSDFTPDFHNPYRIPYTITCEVSADLSLQTTSQASTTADDAILDDVNSVQDLQTTSGLA